MAASAPQWTGQLQNGRQRQLRTKISKKKLHPALELGFKLNTLFAWIKLQDVLMFKRITCLEFVVKLIKEGNILADNLNESSIKLISKVCYILSVIAALE